MDPKALEQFSDKHILVVGDIMLDRYTFGNVERISPEAPVPVLHKTSEEYVLGGAANAAHNVMALGARVSLAGVVGADDNEKTIVFDLLSEKGIDNSCILLHKTKPTIVKQRFYAGSHQIFRADTEDISSLIAHEENWILEQISKDIVEFDAIIFSDYAKGLFSENFTQNLIRLGREHNKLMIADVKPSRYHYFQGVDYITPNLKEAREMAQDETGSVEQVGTTLAEELRCTICITAGADGMYVFPKDGGSKHLPASKVSVFDVTGAGDTVLAVMAVGLCSGLNLVDAAKLANYAGSLVVQKIGTATVSREELASMETSTQHVEQVDIVPKLWGYEKWLENNERYCSKLLVLNKGFQCSLHYHKIKDEMFLVTKGYVRMEVGDEVLFMRPGQFVRIHPKVQHRFRGLEDSEILEISTEHKEEDSYRVEESRKVE